MVGQDQTLLTLDASSLTAGDTAPLVTEVISGSSWKLESSQYARDLADGSYTLIAVGVDEFGNLGPLSSEVSISVNASGATVPQILGIGESDTGRPADGLTKDDTPVVKGVGAANGSIDLKIYNASNTLVQTHTNISADGGGFWTVSLTSIADGTYRVVANASGSSESSGSYALVIDTVVAAPVILTAPGVVGTSQPVIAGTAEANARVQVFSASTLLGETQASAAGTWTYMPNSPLADGIYTISAKAIDLAGNLSEASTVISLEIKSAAPTITFGVVSGNDVVSGFDRDTTDVVLSGSATTGSSVSVVFGSQSRLATVVDDEQNDTDGFSRWTYVLKPADFDFIGAQDDVQFTVSAINVLGVASTASRTVDFRTAPVATPGKPVVSSASGGNATVFVSPGAAGSITGTKVVSANAIVLNSATDIDVRTNVSSAALNAKGTSVSLKNDGALSLTATMEDGRPQSDFRRNDAC